LGERGKSGRTSFIPDYVITNLKRSLVVQACVEKVNSPGGFSWLAFL